MKYVYIHTYYISDLNLSFSREASPETMAEETELDIACYLVLYDVSLSSLTSCPYKFKSINVYPHTLYFSLCVLH